MSKLSFVILAAGKGVRMRSPVPKPLIKISGKSMLERVVESARRVPAERIIAVTGGGDVEQEARRLGCINALQKEALGTGDALKKALPGCFPEGEVLVSCADIPLIPPEVFRKIYNKNREEGTYMTVLTARAPDPSGYGRVITEKGRVRKIVEEKEASEAEKGVDLVNSGVYCIKRSGLEKFLDEIGKSPVKGEYYLTDLPEVVIKNGLTVRGMSCPWELVQGVNTPGQLRKAGEVLEEKKEG